VAGDISVPTTTLDELMWEEARLFETAEARLGQPYAMAREATLLLTTFVGGIQADRTVFIRCLALMKKHFTLAVVSIARRHHVQAMMNLRQVIEAASNAAYALGTPAADYVEPVTGLAMDSKEVSKRSYAWLDANYPTMSDDLKGIKDHLNDTSSHFNLVQSGRIVGDEPKNGVWETGFFDEEDDHLSHIDLWSITHAALASLALFEAVRLKHGGYFPAADLEERAIQLHDDWQTLAKGMMETPRHKAATLIAEEAAAKKAAAKGKP
jgi:hypothetical protein